MIQFISACCNHSSISVVTHQGATCGHGGHCSFSESEKMPCRTLTDSPNVYKSASEYSGQQIHTYLHQPTPVTQDLLLKFKMLCILLFVLPAAVFQVLLFQFDKMGQKIRNFKVPVWMDTIMLKRSTVILKEFFLRKQHHVWIHSKVVRPKSTETEVICLRLYSDLRDFFFSF